MNREELVWAAGFFDGEGSIGVYPVKKYPQIQMSVNQLNRMVLDRFCEAVGVGKVYGPYQKKTQKHPQHQWQTSSWLGVHKVALSLMPFLSPIKLEQCWKALEKYAHWYENYTVLKHGYSVYQRGGYN